MNKNITNMIVIDDDVRKRIVELVLGEQVNVKSEKEAEFKAAFAKMLEDFTEREITHSFDDESLFNALREKGVYK